MLKLTLRRVTNEGVNFLSLKRRNIIKGLLAQKPFVSLQELETIFPDVSSMTLRRDIEYFERLGDAIKVRGGARSMKFITNPLEDSFSKRLGENVGEKEKLAKHAATMIETGRSIFLDSGTTILRLAEILPNERITVTTAGVNIATELIKKDLPIVNVVGGMLNRDSLSLSGNQTLGFIENINIDVAFMVPSGASVKGGLTCGNNIECELKKLVVEKAERVVVLMDSSKFDRSMPYTFCNIDRIDDIITDKPLPDGIKRLADAGGVRVTVV